jgi:hypothetical protein
MFYIIWRIFSQFKYFFGEKTQTNDSDVGGLSLDPVLILNLDPGLNPDPSGNPDPVTNLDPVADPDPVEYRSGCRIRVRINLATNPDQFSYSMAVLNPDLVTKLDPRTNPVTDPGLAPNLFTNLDSEQEPDRESVPDSESDLDLDPDLEQDPDCKQYMDSIKSGFLPLSLRTAND